MPQQQAVSKSPCNHNLASFEATQIRGALFKFVRSRIFSSSDAEDIVQDTMHIIISKFDQYNSTTNTGQAIEIDKKLLGWAYAICRFQIKKYFTNRTRNREFTCSVLFNSDDELSDKDLGNFSEALHVKSAQCPFSIFDQKESKQNKINLINQLSHNRLTAREKEFYDYMSNGLSKSSIVKAMKLSKSGQYYVWKRRVLKRLKFHANRNTNT